MFTTTKKDIPERLKSLLSFKGADYTPQKTTVVVKTVSKPAVQKRASPTVQRNKSPSPSNASSSLTSLSSNGSARSSPKNASYAPRKAVQTRPSTSRDEGSLSASSLSSPPSSDDAGPELSSPSTSGGVKRKFEAETTFLCHEKGRFPAGGVNPREASDASSRARSAPSSSSPTPSIPMNGLNASPSLSCQALSNDPAPSSCYSSTSLAVVAPKYQRAHSSPASPLTPEVPLPYKRAKTTPEATPEPFPSPRPHKLKLKRSKADLTDVDDDASEYAAPPRIRKKRRPKRLNDTTLQPLKGSYHAPRPVPLRSESSSRQTTESEIASGMLKSVPLGERRTWAEADGNVRSSLKTSKEAVEELIKKVTYWTCK